jgi:hypothetical protein
MRNTVAKELRRLAKYKPVHGAVKTGTKLMKTKYATFEVDTSEPLELTPEQQAAKDIYRATKKQYGRPLTPEITGA